MPEAISVPPFQKREKKASNSVHPHMTQLRICDHTDLITFIILHNFGVELPATGSPTGIKQVEEY
jgi:hypothetical protein